MRRRRVRRGRDALVQSDESFRAAVLDYYRKAPMIVAHIMREPRRDEILRELYETMVAPYVALLKAGKTDEAKAAYLESYRALCGRYEFERKTAAASESTGAVAVFLMKRKRGSGRKERERGNVRCEILCEYRG